MAKSKPFGKAKAGSGKRFAACVQKMKNRKGIRNPHALCASIEGKKRFTQLGKKMSVFI